MAEPLTDEMLSDLEVDLNNGPGKYISAVEGLDIAIARALVAEVRRLRSDEWLERVADDLVRAATRHDIAGGTRYLGTAEALAILRKHRDGEA